MSTLFNSKPDFGSLLSQFIGEPNTEELRARAQVAVKQIVQEYIQRGMCSLDGNRIYAEDMEFVKGFVMSGMLNVGEWYEVYIQGQHIGRIRDKRGTYRYLGSAEWDVEMELDETPADYVRVDVVVKE